MGAALTFGELQAEAAALNELGNFTDSTNAPDWAALINYAYEEAVWRTESNRESLSLTSVLDQAEYTLVAPNWKILSLVMFDGNRIKLVSETALGVMHPTWPNIASSTPIYYWRPRPRVLRLFPAPSAASLTIYIRGVRAPADMTTDSEEPVMLAPVHHAGLAKRAYWRHAERFARGDERTVIQDQITQYLDTLQAVKGELGQEAVLGTSRYRQPVEAEVI